MKHRRFDQPRSSVALGEQPAPARCWSPGRPCPGSTRARPDRHLVPAGPGCRPSAATRRRLDDLRSTPIEITTSKPVKKIFAPKSRALAGSRR